MYQLAGQLLGEKTYSSSGLKESEIWNAREDYAIACIQLGKREQALSIVNKVVAEFPSSCRALRLKGMYLESIGKREEANTAYELGLQKIDRSTRTLPPISIRGVNPLYATRCTRVCGLTESFEHVSRP